MATASANRPSLGTFITKPGYWFITGRNAAGQNVAGVVKYTSSGRLPNATQAVFVNRLGLPALNMKSLQAAIQSTGSTFLYEVPATGSHTNLQSIGARAVGSGNALYSSAQAGVQPTNDIAVAALLAAAPIAAGIAGGGTVAGEAAAGGATAGGAAAGAAAGGGAAGVASKVASKVAAAATSSTAAKVLGGVAITTLLTETGLWKGVAMVIAGAVLAFLALRQVAGAAT